MMRPAVGISTGVSAALAVVDLQVAWETLKELKERSNDVFRGWSVQGDNIVSRVIREARARPV
jgi:hypothetical protein